MSSMPIVTADGLTKHFKTVNALTDFNISIESGEVVGLLGPNGSGKSTLVRLLMGFLRPSSGSASIIQHDCTRDRVEVHKHVAYLPGDARMFRTMRGRDVLNFFARIRGEAFIDVAHEISRRLDLDLSRWVAFMSTGMRQKLAIAVVMSMDTPVLILDEPTANLDPSVRDEVLALVASAQDNGRTVLFSSHVLSEIEQVCTRAIILRSGKLVHEQSLRSQCKQHHVQILHSSPLLEFSEQLGQYTSNKATRYESNTNQHRTTLNVDNNLQEVLGWLANSKLESVDIRPANLRSIYEQHHQAEI